VVGFLIAGHTYTVASELQFTKNTWWG